MKNPLRKRLPRELRGDIGKYLVIFLLLTFTIGFISGFLVADGSMIIAYNESFEKYNIEDGNFRTQKELNRAQEKAISEEGVRIYPLFYQEKLMENGSTLRIFQNRDEVDRVCVLKGRLPEREGEIAVDRMYAVNNGLSVGDTISVAADTGSWVITGLVALSDYSALFADNNDTMFDAVKFGVAVVSAQEFSSFPEEETAWNYAFKYTSRIPKSEAEEEERAEKLMEQISGEVSLENFIPQYANQAIIFTGNDMGSDRAMMELLLYIMIAIIAFVFGVTISNTIAREAPVIGTLRASGYTRGELIRHYMELPVVVTLVSALVGNVLGYTVFKEVCAAMYYRSYSLPTYVTIWNADAFLLTTVIPILLMAVITWGVLRRALSLSPLRFLRRDLRRREKKRTFPLNERIPFMHRFRIRVVLQNLPNYVTLFIGILFANLLLMFGLGLPVVLDHYEAIVAEDQFCKYQYLLQVPYEAMDDSHKLKALLSLLQFTEAVETENPDAEKFSAYSLRTTGDDGVRSDEISVYGAKDSSRYISGMDRLKEWENREVNSTTNQDTDREADGKTAERASQEVPVLISSAYAQRHRLQEGDEITLKEQYKDDSYSFRVAGIYPYEAGLMVFMRQSDLNQIFNLGDDYFSGYLSDTEIDDIDDKYVATVINIEALTRVSRQLRVSMGDMMSMVDVFSVVIFVVLLYLLSKIIIEKNAQSISMVKILGYRGNEIAGLYIRSTTIVFVILELVSLPVMKEFLDWIWGEMVRSEMTGWLTLYLSRAVYAKMIALALGSYAAVSVLEYRRIAKVPMDEALKNVE